MTEGAAKKAPFLSSYQWSKYHLISLWRKEARISKYYYTANFEDPAVYHHSQQCEEGQKIEPKSRVDTPTTFLPTGDRATRASQ